MANPPITSDMNSDPVETNGDTKDMTMNLSPEEKVAETRRIMKNVVLISISFTCLFTAFQSMAYLQSSINPNEGLGTASLSVIYVALVLSCMFLPTYLIKTFTVKWTLCFCMLTYSLYIAGQFYPRFYTLIPGAIILGMGAAPMWSAKCTYLSQVGAKYAELTGSNVEQVVVKFFGIFFFCFQTSLDFNATEEELSKCGINFCGMSTNTSNNSNLEPPADSKIYTLSSIYLICALSSAVIIAFFVDPLTRYGEADRNGPEGKEPLSGYRLLIATFLHLRNPYQLLILPLTLWSGVEQGYFSAEFTRAYVSCSWGTANIGYVLICYGIVDAMCSYSFGYVIKIVGRIPIFLTGAVVNVLMLIVLFNWAPTPDQIPVFFVIAGFWGMADAVWQTQINALYGILFPDNEEAGFSNYRLWESLGFILAYALNNTACVRATSWIVLVVLLIGVIGYLGVEYLSRKKAAQSISISNGGIANPDSIPVGKTKGYF
ncbi:unnamed protein product [Cyprideis torosa]|uniref:Uncharacterized protein n=1 Tax=Cyprideis torosa TaxID=163714 RepID=A0A7R8W4L8_9CRUS|nr:unnamed protein product [Cyprideis torosa]CAG0879668.1 unnamed protein product [Cyprideis torosa]